MTTTTFDRGTLLRLCTQVRPALATADYIPALTHICFDGEYATAYNDISAISVACVPGFKALVPGELLIKALQSFKGEQVALTLGDKLLVQCGRSKVNLPVLPVSKFPFKLPAAGDIEVELTNEVTWGVDRCLIAVGTDGRQPARMGVTLEASRTGKAALFSTDGVTISKASTNAPIVLPGGTPLILPTFFCEQLVALAKAYVEVPRPLLELQPGALVASFGDKAIMCTKCPVDIEPLDFLQVISKHVDLDKIEYTALSESWTEVIGRSLLVQSNAIVKRIKISRVTKDSVMVSSTSAMGESEDIIDWTGPDFNPLMIDPTLMARALKQTNSVHFGKMVTVFANADRTFIHVVATYKP
jgi:DNA polymerase III sliding clamp (beta) subunit (PCNA family)